MAPHCMVQGLSRRMGAPKLTAGESTCLMRKLLLFFSTVAAVIGFAMLVADISASLIGGRLVLTSTQDLLLRASAPASLERLQNVISNKTHTIVWQIVRLLVLAPPAALVAAAASLIFWLPARRRRAPPVRLERPEGEG